MHLRKTTAATTLPELMISAVIIGVFFASIFEVNAVCLRLVNGSKENIAAIQGVQDRLETLRNLAFTDLTNAVYLRDTVMASSANVSDLASRVTEEVSVVAYDTDSPSGGTVGSGIKLIRTGSGASKAPSIVA